jgi:hypothetical protein
VLRLIGWPKANNKLHVRRKSLSSDDPDCIDQELGPDPPPHPVPPPDPRRQRPEPAGERRRVAEAPLDPTPQRVQLPAEGTERPLDPVAERAARADGAPQQLDAPQPVRALAAMPQARAGVLARRHQLIPDGPAASKTALASYSPSASR